ncbi:Abi family protein [Marinivivus vitaminiproducens]|uniref:Abi family protein n=1 Tax=Marinivivus vitaminiproducens TaxID=3035935 RepID=UPI0027AAD89A|nr:Abi family protein [Geminicoccaceae bacterium SCSIO 64248]
MDAQLAGFLLAKIEFDKPALSVPDHIGLLKTRGMTISDIDRAAHYLRFIGYYRLSGYWFPFQYRDQTAKHDHFREGTDFESVLDRYIFDRQLRLLAMDALERIEIAARAAMSDVMSERHGAHWYRKSRLFKHGMHASFLETVRRDSGIEPYNTKRQTDFIRHYVQTYNRPIEPPSWMVFEILSFGSVSWCFKSLVNTEKAAIASQFGFHRTRIESWLHSASHLRNLCAHHSRVWNRTFGVFPVKGDHIVPNPKRFYNHASMIQAMLTRISADTRWAERLRELIASHPNIDPAEMGFPTQWPDRSPWR